MRIPQGAFAGASDLLGKCGTSKRRKTITSSTIYHTRLFTSNGVGVFEDELLGKIEAHYQRMGQEAPFGLPAAPVEKLREHLKRLQQR